MSGWHHANAARAARTDQRASDLADQLGEGVTFKRAAWLAGIPERTARRYRRRIGQ